MHFHSKNSDLSQIPKGIGALIQQQNSDTNQVTEPSRRSFLKMSVASGFALLDSKPSSNLRPLFTSVKMAASPSPLTDLNLVRVSTLPCQ